MFSLFVDPSITSGMVMGVEIPNNHGILEGQSFVEEAAIDIRRSVSVKVSIKIYN